MVAVAARSLLEHETVRMYGRTLAAGVPLLRNRRAEGGGYRTCQAAASSRSAAYCSRTTGVSSAS